ncbi:MAG TPA: maleylpyruvate isomerase family mycothiol-dependent enzyme [Nocardioides sp.]
MDKDLAWRHTVEQRRALAGILGSLSPEEWEHESLCAGWTVRDVAAHVITSPQLQQGRLIWETVKAGGNVSAVALRDAKRRAAAPTSEILADYERLAEGKKHFIGTGRADLLLDVIVHTQDIVRPLGRTHAVPPEAAALAADRARRLAFLLHSRSAIRQHRMVATDVDWDRGKGSVIEAPMLELLMMCAGRGVSVSPDIRGN